jgi:hypothetical protein
VNVLRRFRKPLEFGFFVEMPVVFIAFLGWLVAGNGGGGDFGIFRQAGHAVAHGHSPFVQPTLQAFAENDKFVYSMPFAIPFIPFSFIPEQVGAVCFLVLGVAAIVLAVRLLGVRDYRCYGAAFLARPTMSTLALGTIGPFLLLLCAAGWRYRDRTRAGVFLALAAAAKLFLWPLLVWLLITRRYRAFLAASATIGVLLTAWAGLDPTGLRRYPETVRLLNDAQKWKSYSVQSLAISLHASAHAAALIGGMVAVAAVAAIVLLRRRGDQTTFATAVCAALIATPILWMHYLVLLIAPIAIMRPRLAPLWIAPIVVIATPHPESLGVVWQIVFDLAIVAIVAVWAVGSKAIKSAEPSTVQVGTTQLGSASA